jgi:hypothetical protein
MFVREVAERGQSSASTVQRSASRTNPTLALSSNIPTGKIDIENETMYNKNIHTNIASNLISPDRATEKTKPDNGASIPRSGLEYRPPPEKLDSYVSSAYPKTNSKNHSQHDSTAVLDGPDPELKLQYQSPTSLAAPDLKSPESSDSLAGFETDSTYSEDEVEGGEIDVFDVRDPSDIFRVIHNELISGRSMQHERMVRTLLSPMKRAMIERIMKEFWVLFNQEWSASARKCAASVSSPSSSATSSEKPCSSSSGQNQGITKEKRSRELDDNQDPGDDEEKDPKRPKRMKPSRNEQFSNAKFACPYRKYKPQKYCVRDWRLCALTPLDSVARVKFVAPM